MIFFSTLFAISIIYIFLYIAVHLFFDATIYDTRYKKLRKVMNVLVVLSFVHAIVYPPIYTMQEKKNQLVLTDEYNKNVSQLKFTPIDEEMMKLIEEQAQKEIESGRKQTNAYQALTKSKNFLKEKIGQSETITFEPDFDCVQDGSIYMVSFRANITLVDKFVIQKKYTFFLEKDDSTPVENVWNILDYKEANL